VWLAFVLKRERKVYAQLAHSLQSDRGGRAEGFKIRNLKKRNDLILFYLSWIQRGLKGILKRYGRLQLLLRSLNSKDFKIFWIIQMNIFVCTVYWWYSYFRKNYPPIHTNFVIQVPGQRKIVGIWKTKIRRQNILKVEQCFLMRNLCIWQAPLRCK